MKNILTIGLIASTLLIGTTKAQAATIFIDNFNDTEDASGTVLTVGQEPTDIVESAIETGLTGVLGGTRSSTLTLLGGEAEAEAAINHLFEVNSGNAALSNDAVLPNGVSSNLNLFYDGFGTTDLSEFQSTSIDIPFLESEAFASISVTFGDGGGNSIFAIADGTMGDPLLPSPLVFETADFGDTSGFDFTSVTSISLDVTGFNAEDVVIDNFRVEVSRSDDPATTPEPAAILGLLFSVGLGTFSRKKPQA